MQNVRKSSYFQSLREDVMAEEESPLREVWLSVARLKNFSYVFVHYLGIYAILFTALAGLGSFMISLASIYRQSTNSGLVRTAGFVFLLLSLVPLLMTLFIPRYQWEAMGQILEYYIEFWGRHYNLTLGVAIASLLSLIYCFSYLIAYLHHRWYTAVMGAITLSLFFTTTMGFALWFMGREEFAEQKTSE